MGNENKTGRALTRMGSIVTDIHFWVPAAVLIGGLVLLHWIR
jgi:hypothetical protein